MRLHLEVKSDNFMRHLDCPMSNFSVCQDYLEVKYNLSFGYTGARFCCGLPPPTNIVSSGNSMLVIFKTVRNGIGGFTAEIYAESCGGCSESPYPQKPCHVAQATACRQEWFKMEFIPCPVYSPLTYVCNKYLPRKHSRSSTCEVEIQRCCKGFSVKGGLCIGRQFVCSVCDRLCIGRQFVCSVCDSSQKSRPPDGQSGHSGHHAQPRAAGAADEVDPERARSKRIVGKWWGR
ncbi:hypothetical protein Btru_042711 [Bulinus truncatus]|nr:hypothetical protein Btru_042711 [Bulinus truncatus]